MLNTVFMILCLQVIQKVHRKNWNEEFYLNVEHLLFFLNPCRIFFFQRACLPWNFWRHRVCMDFQNVVCHQSKLFFWFHFPPGVGRTPSWLLLIRKPDRDLRFTCNMFVSHLLGVKSAVLENARRERKERNWILCNVLGQGKGLRVCRWLAVLWPSVPDGL